MPLQGRNFTDLIQTQPAGGRHLRGGAEQPLQQPPDRRRRQQRRLRPGRGRVPGRPGAGAADPGRGGEGVPGARGAVRRAPGQLYRRAREHDHQVRAPTSGPAPSSPTTRTRVSPASGTIRPSLDSRSASTAARSGGPIIRDRLHFFAAVDIQDRNAPFSSSFNLTGDDASDIARTGFTVADADRFRDILENTYGMTGVGDRLRRSCPTRTSTCSAS